METSQNPMEPTGKEIGNVIFWFRNQVAFTFRSKQVPAAGKQQIINELPLDQLNQLLRDELQVTLRSFEEKDILQSKGATDGNGQHQGDLQPKGATDGNSQHQGDLRDPTGKYLFPSPEEPEEPGKPGSILVAFFHIVDEVPPKKEADPTPNEFPPSSESETQCHPYSGDRTADVVNLINKKQTTSEDVDLPTAMPNWLAAGTDDVGHGCPITPPIAVDAGDRCAKDPGRWPITVSPLPGDLEEANGAGVTVLVLDAFPKKDTIATASCKVPAGANKLLQDMATNMVVTETPFPPMSSATSMATPPAINLYYPSLSGDGDPSGQNEPKTGKDIDGNLIGYPMADHGLFVAGIIRSLVPAANIVCIRVLNDFGVCDASALFQTFEAIANHVGTDLPLPLIINMSMVVTPYDDQLSCLGLEGELSPAVRDGLRTLLQALANAGVIVVAAAGNDTDPRSGMCCMDMADGTRLGPRYPAAFADSIAQIISVGAVDGSEQPAYYSNYPGGNGVATYGGGLPVRDDASSQPGNTRAKQPIDALRGVYTTPYYPDLSKDDANSSTSAPTGIKYPEKDAPNDNAWAYWSGTSFATPIITGLTARILQVRTLASGDVRQQVIDLAGTQDVSWTGLNPDVLGPVIYAWQCQSQVYPENSDAS